MDIKLETSPNGRPFVWVVAVGPGEGSELLALSDDRTGRSFIPIFSTREDALQGLGRLRAAGAPPGEVQAMELQDLAGQAEAGGLGVLILDKDGNILEDSKSRAVVERRRMAFSGCAFVAIAMTAQGELVDEPEVDLVGIPEKNRAGEPLDDIVFDAVMSTIESLPKARRRDPDALAESVRRAVRAVINEHWGKKPPCLVHVLTV